MTGSNPGDFAIESTGTTCPTSSGTVGIGQNCTVAVAFAPQSGGAKSAKLSISDNVAGSPQLVTLNGTATAPPSLQVSPSILPAFGIQSEGTTSAPQTVTIANTGSTAADISGVAVTGPNMHDFPLTDSCAPSLAAGNSCQVSVAFDPAVSTPPGSRSATLDVPGANPSAIALSGTATQAAVSVPTSINFGSQLAGTAGSAQPITVMNTGNGALVVSTATMQGTNGADFVIGSDSCVTGSTPPDATCTIQLSFKPVEGQTCGASPNRSANLALTDNAADQQQTIPLSGTAMDFCFQSPSGENISTPITSGQPFSYSMSVSSSGGFSGSLGLSCSLQIISSVVPTPQDSCSTSPDTVQVTPGTPGQFDVDVTTSAGAPALLRKSPRPHGGCLPLSAIFCLLLLILVAAQMQSNEDQLRRLPRFAAAGFLLLAWAVGMAACGGQGSDPSSSLPPASYTVQVTVTATPAGGGTTRQIPLTFTVN